MCIIVERIKIKGCVIANNVIMHPFIFTLYISEKCRMRVTEEEGRSFMEEILLEEKNKISYIVLAVILIVVLMCNLFIFIESGTEQIFNSNYGFALFESNSQIGLNTSEGVKVEQIAAQYDFGWNYDKEEVKEIEKYIDLRNEEQLKKVFVITQNTPLDIHTASIIVNYSEKLDVPISLIMALIELESQFVKYEVGGAEDRGYCQIIPGTEKWLADTYGHILGLEYNPERIFEPEYNIGLGALYLYHLKNAYKDDYHRILSEYNRGPYNLKAYYNKTNTYVTTYSNVVLKKEVKYKDMLTVY